MSSVGDPGRFIAEALAWLPKPPHRSLVVMSLREVACWPDAYIAVECVRREDLYLTREHLATVPILARTRGWCAKHRPDAVAVVVIDDPSPDTPFPRDEHRELAALLRDQLAELRVGTLGAWSVTGPAAGHPWASLFGGEHGLLPYAAPRGDSVEDLPPDLVADTELADDMVRDSLYAFAVSARGVRGQWLWALRVRALPSPHRAPAAMLCAVTAYVHGDRDRALAAVRIALADDPDNETVQAMVS
ncbi:DUF4192 family protein [Nocardia abscessus]|uniref:DUF4192 family protein n=1 Tax=Nocardia abscessus TaxID=120957 RepID=UPI0018961EF5|nr:DUF4192 family protein [Nocardia abscessus]MBF6339052.1 DUF4192 family protein [Nocardia abscessus]